MTAVFGSPVPLEGGRKAIKLTAEDSPARTFALHWSRYRDALRQVGYDGPAGLECVGGHVRLTSAPPESQGYSNFRLNDAGRLVSFSLEGFSIAHSVVLGPPQTRGPFQLRGRVYSAEDSHDSNVLFVVVNITNPTDAVILVSMRATSYRDGAGDSVSLVDATRTDPFSIEPRQSVTLGLGFTRRPLGGVIELTVARIVERDETKTFKLKVPRAD